MTENKSNISVLEKKFIESDNFPVSIVSLASGKEKMIGGRPPYWDMIFWWTRKPLSSARAIIAGCLLPDKTNPKEFIDALVLDKNFITHKYNPNIPPDWVPLFEGRKLLDPFSGFGSIPLEARRLGIDTTSVELLPTPYVFLKSVLEHPGNLGHQLIMNVRKWGDWVTENLKHDLMIEDLYENDVLSYICSWEILCPHCNRLTPLIGSFWLVKGYSKNVRNKNQNETTKETQYKRLAWFSINKEDLSVSITDLNNESTDFQDLTITDNIIKRKNELLYAVEKPNIRAKSKEAICLKCRTPIKYVDPETGKHYLETKNIPQEIKKKLQWYVKYAIRKYHAGDTFIANQKLFVKVKKVNRDLKFYPCDETDQERLKKSQNKLTEMLSSLDPDIPLEEISPYSGRYILPLDYGIKQWYQLFNPRQLIVLLVLIRLIRTAVTLVEQEIQLKAEGTAKIANLAEAVATYLGLAVCNVADFNSISSQWDSSAWEPKHLYPTKRSFHHRGLVMQWNYSDSTPFSGHPGSWTNALENVIKGIRYLTSLFTSEPLLKSSTFGHVKNILDDATYLGKLNEKEKFDLVITDPPYYDDVPYTELSDFYYVWLKRCLSRIEHGKLYPKYISEAFFKKIENQNIEIKTQWEEFATREVSKNVSRPGQETDESAKKYFQKLFDISFFSMQSFLKDDGFIVTYYAHTDPEAWKALLRAGWEISGLTVANAFPITTESSQSPTKKGKLSLDTSIIVVWKKGAKGTINASKLYDQMVEVSKTRVQSLTGTGILGRDIFVASLAASLCEATKYRDVLEMKKLNTFQLVDQYVIRAALYGVVKAISARAKVEEGIKTGQGILYLITKFLYSGRSEKKITSDDARIFSLGTGISLADAIRTYRLFRDIKDVTKGRSMILVEPGGKDKSKLRSLLDYKEIDIENPKCRFSVDALHLLEYYALNYSREEYLRRFSNLKTKYPSEVEEALSLARVISASLLNDIEGEICSGLLEKTMAVTRKIDGYLGV